MSALPYSIIFFSLFNLAVTVCNGQHTMEMISKKDIIRISENDSSKYFYINKTHNDWVYAINKLDIINEKIMLLHKVVKIASIRYELGEIDLMTKIKLNEELNKCVLDQKLLQYEIQIEMNRLKSIFAIKTELFPEEDSLTKHHSFLINKANQYLHGMNAADTVRNQTYVLNALLVLKKHHEILRYYENKLKYTTNKIKNFSDIQIKLEEIDFIDHYTNLRTTYTDKLNYLEALRKYNESVFSLEGYFIKNNIRFEYK